MTLSLTVDSFGTIFGRITQKRPLLICRGLYIKVRLLTPKENHRRCDPIARKLSESPDYRPNWRTLTTEEYLIDIAQAPDQSEAIDKILDQEKDVVIRQLVRFHSGRPCIASSEMAYAIRCYTLEAQVKTGALIKGMVIANRTAQEIAIDLGTTPLAIILYEKIAFDVRRFRNHPIWIKQLCFPVLPQSTPPHLQSEARLLALAFTRGWPGLAAVIYPPDPASDNADLDRVMRVLLGRAADFLDGLEFAGISPGPVDLELLLSLQAHQLSSTESLRRLVYPKPLNPQQRAERDEAKALAGSLSPLARKRLCQLLDKCRIDPPDT